MIVRKGSARFASSTMSFQLSFCPAFCQSLRHSWMSHRPMILLSGRNPPWIVPSFEKFASRTASVKIGLSVSTPNSDHVPDEQNAKLPVPGMAATAEAVSCVPTAAKRA